MSASVIRSLKQIPSLRDVSATQDSGNRELSVRVDREKAKEFGFSANDVAQFIAIALRGMQLKDFHGSDSQLPVWLRFRGADARSVDDLSDYKLRRPDGSQIPLMSMVRIETRNASSVIERDSRQTSLGIKANLAEGATTDDARKAITTILNTMPFKPGYSWTFSRNFCNRDDDAGAKMGFNLLVALVLVYVVMMCDVRNR